MLLKNKSAEIYVESKPNGGEVARVFVGEGISIPQLRAALNGRVIAPDEAAYDEARTVFYGGFDRRPAVIVRPADEADISHVVSLA